MLQGATQDRGELHDEPPSSILGNDNLRSLILQPHIDKIGFLRR